MLLSRIGRDCVENTSKLNACICFPGYYHRNNKGYDSIYCITLTKAIPSSNRLQLGEIFECAKRGENEIAVERVLEDEQNSLDDGGDTDDEGLDGTSPF